MGLNTLLFQLEHMNRYSDQLLAPKEMQNIKQPQFQISITKINAYENLKILLKVVIEEGQKGRRGGGLVGK